MAHDEALAPATVAIAVLLFSGCSASEVINTGGDTKCKDFTAQDEKKQNDEISGMLKDKRGAEPNNLGDLGNAPVGVDLLPNDRHGRPQDL